MTLHRVAVLLVLGLVGVSRGLCGQERSVTLADAIRLSERVQPTVVRAAGDVGTAAAQRRSAWGGYLPSLSASSSASTFSSEGPSRVDPMTGQLVSGNSSNRSLNTSLSASLDLFTGFRRGAEMGAAAANQTAAEASYVDARFQQALATTNQFLRRARRPATGRRARGQRSPGRGAAQDLGRQAARGLCHAIRLPSLTRYSGQRAARPDPGPDRPGDGGGRARAADRRDRPGAGRSTTRPSTGSSSRSTPPRSVPRPRPRARGSRARVPMRTPREPTSRPPAPPTGPVSRWPSTRHGTPAARPTMNSSISGSSAWDSSGTCSTGSSASWRSPSERRASMWRRRSPPTSAGRSGRSSPHAWPSWRPPEARSTSR